MSLHGSSSLIGLLACTHSGATLVIRIYDDDTSFSQRQRASITVASRGDSVLAELGVVGLLLLSLSSLSALVLGHLSSEGTGLFLAQIVGSVPLFGKSILCLGAAFLVQDSEDFRDVFADCTHLRQLD